MKERFIAFYTQPPFWCGETPDLETLDKDRGQISHVFEEVIFEKVCDLFSIKICKDGLIMIRIIHLDEEIDKLRNLEGEITDHNKLEKLNSDYLVYLNAFLLIFESAACTEKKWGHFKISKIKNGEAFPITFENGSCKGSSLPEGISKYYYQGRYGIYYPANLPITTAYPIMQRVVLDIKIFDSLVSNYERVVSNWENIKILSQITTAMGECNNSDYPASLIQSWFAIEYFLNCYWFKFLSEKRITYDDGQKRINSKRIDFLIGTDFSISITSNILELIEYIPFSQFKKIDYLRRKRNEIVHETELVSALAQDIKGQQSNKDCGEVTIDDCVKAFEVLRYFLSDLFKLDLTINTSFQHSTFS